MTLSGIDVSRHQGTVDFAAVARSGKAFAFIKATDGVGYRHIGWFHTHAPKVRAAGLTLGAYHFLLDHHSGAAQARYYVAEVNRVGGFGGVVPVVDIEREADGTTPRLSHLRDFVAEFRRLVPNRPILIYTGRWYWVGVLGNPHGADLGPLWHSEYDGISPLDANVADGPELDNYGGWASALVWQHTSSGSCPGVSGRCDLNIFYGDRSQLLKLAGAGNLQEDDMTPDECRNVVRDELRRALAFLTTGAGNQLTGAETWVPGAVTLNELATEAPTVEEIADAVIAKLPAGSVDAAAVVTAVVAGVRSTLAGVEVKATGHFELAD